MQEMKRFFLYVSKKEVSLRKISLEGMKRKLFISLVSCILAMAIQAETIRVLRFVHVDGTESEVAQNSLQKVVFTRDSVMRVNNCKKHSLSQLIASAVRFL